MMIQAGVVFVLMSVAFYTGYLLGHVRMMAKYQAVIGLLVQLGICVTKSHAMHPTADELQHKRLHDIALTGRD